MKTYILGTDKWTLLVNVIGRICPDGGQQKTPGFIGQYKKTGDFSVDRRISKTHLAHDLLAALANMGVSEI